jgi:MoxR-like ATPase
MAQNIIRPHTEVLYQEELAELKAQDKAEKPENWVLSPKAVVDFIIGTKLKKGFDVSPKYIGNRRLIEIAVATLATDRALLLLGVPGTAKSWVSENIAAAISGDSTLMVQGTYGMHEEQIRYGWNYAKLLTEGPNASAIVESPIMKAMRLGKIARIEELTRMPSDVQDSLITILSEKYMPIPELGTEVQALQGFNIIATANDKDKGINDLSGAMRRRFNTVVLPLPATIEEEVNIVKSRMQTINEPKNSKSEEKTLAEIKRVVTIFRELRSGATEDNKQKLKKPSTILSTAEAISVINNGLVLSKHFGDGMLSVDDIAAGIVGAIIKDPTNDKQVWEEYVETVLKKRDHWVDFYKACQKLNG